ncbi:MAG: DNA-binding protein [Clostridia bacterium]|nr:DNA-binding protein [Clostridia bacterium]
MDGVKGGIAVKDDLDFLRLRDLYSPLLTDTQREIADLYFNYDLSLAEIAEEKGVSRQSVSDCLQKCRKQLETYEEKLGFAKTLGALDAEYTRYATAVEKFLKTQKQGDKQEKALWVLEAELAEIRK